MSIDSIHLIGFLRRILNLREEICGMGWVLFPCQIWYGTALTGYSYQNLKHRVVVSRRFELGFPVFPCGVPSRLSLSVTACLIFCHVVSLLAVLRGEPARLPQIAVSAVPHSRHPRRSSNTTLLCHRVLKATGGVRRLARTIADSLAKLDPIPDMALVVLYKQSLTSNSTITKCCYLH